MNCANGDGVQRAVFAPAGDIGDGLATDVETEAAEHDQGSGVDDDFGLGSRVVLVFDSEWGSTETGNSSTGRSDRFAARFREDESCALEVGLLARGTAKRPARAIEAHRPHLDGRPVGTAVRTCLDRRHEAPTAIAAHPGLEVGGANPKGAPFAVDRADPPGARPPNRAISLVEKRGQASIVA
jgi:hypothetical protein